MGFSNITFGIGQGLGAWAGGAIFDHSGSYHLAALTAIPFLIVKVIFFWIKGPRKMRRIIANIHSG